MSLKDTSNFSTGNVEGSRQQTPGDRINTHNTYIKRGIGLFLDYQSTENAVMELQGIGHNMDDISVISQDSDSVNQSGQMGTAQVRDDEGNRAEDSVKTGAVSGGAIGGAAGGLLGGLVGSGMPEKQAQLYNNRVSAGEYLVMVDGTDAEIRQAEAILTRHGIREWQVYDVPTTGSATVNPAASTVPGTHQGTRPVNPVGERTTSQADAETVKLREERLVIDKNRQKTGEVAIGKHTETDTMRVSTPVEKESVVIANVPVDDEKVAPSTGDPFDQQETMRVELFEETPTVHKEVFVREEVGIGKKTTQETVNTEETLRREELDVDSEGRPLIDNRTHRPNRNRR